MGKITLTVEGTTVGTVAAGGGIQIPYEVSETDSARLVAAMADFYKSRLDGSGRRGPGGLEVTPPEPPTVEDIVRAWFNDVVRLALNQTRDFEQRNATVAPIVVTGV